MRQLVSSALLAGAALAAVLVSGTAYAGCTYPRAPDSMPNGGTASMEEMVAGQKQVKQYMADMDVYLKCLDDEAAPAPAADAPDDQKKEAARQESIRAQKHNAAVAEMEAVADRFNQQLKAFKEKSKK